MARLGLERQHSFAQYIACGHSEWLQGLERQHSIAQYTACGKSEWLAWIWKDNILLHNTLHVVIVNGSL